MAFAGAIAAITIVIVVAATSHVPPSSPCPRFGGVETVQAGITVCAIPSMLIMVPPTPWFVSALRIAGVCAAVASVMRMSVRRRGVGAGDAWS